MLANATDISRGKWDESGGRGKHSHPHDVAEVPSSGFRIKPKARQCGMVGEFYNYSIDH